ncbi:MAG TPA: thiamine pyrophosphate-binding protein [Candidatus Methylomirabilis sp.]|nr:thiamine pyrophosphate-binding protein [Candidatus Methylomirabilis sp.]
MPHKLTGARFIAETFRGYGVTHVFFVEAILRRALIEMEALGIKRVLTHSEKAAAYMADGYARMSRRPGVCMAQSVGAANLASGLQEPFLGCAPVIALTGRKSLLAQYRNAYQEILHGPLFEPVTKYNVNVDTLEQLPYLLRQALREATSGCPGPAHLDLLGHQGHLIEDAEAELDVVIEASFARSPSRRPAPEMADVREAARLLARAERPVIVAGGGAATSSAGPEIVRLAEMLAMPVATSLNGKETLLESHPLNVGVVGRYSRWCANRVVSEADLVLFIGSNTGDHVTNGGSIPRAGTPVIQIDIDPGELGRSYPNAVGMHGDAKISLQQLIQSLSPRSAPRPWAQHAQALVQQWRDELEPLRASDAAPIRPERLCKAVTECLPSNAVLVADTGYAAIWTGTQVYLTHPEQRYIRCAGSLGWGFPASLGVKCAAPDRPVVCFTGDGGFWYHLSELETARRCGIHSVTVVNNNSALGQCLGSIEKLYAGKPGDPGEMCRFSDVSFARIAAEMGCWGVRVEKPGEIADALRRALDIDRPAVVEVITDVKCPAPDPWTP